MGGFATGAQCLGCMESNACLCLECEFCCKSGVEPLCLYCCALRKIDITVLCKGQAQCCCLVGAGAIPCDDEVPHVRHVGTDLPSQGRLLHEDEGHHGLRCARTRSRVPHCFLAKRAVASFLMQTVAGHGPTVERARMYRASPLQACRKEPSHAIVIASNGCANKCGGNHKSHSRPSFV